MQLNELPSGNGYSSLFSFSTYNSNWSYNFGFVQQIIRAFGRVETSLQYLVRSWPIIVELISVWKRLNEFENKLKVNTENISKEEI